MAPGGDGIIPLAVQLVRRDIDCGHLRVRDLDAVRVEIGMNFAFHVQAGPRGRVGDQLHDGVATDQGFAAPVLCDEGEQPVFDLVPFAGTWRQMANGDRQTEFVGEILQFPLP